MQTQKNHQPRISLVAGIILIAVTLLVGVTVFVVMLRHAEELLSKSLQSSLQNRVQLTQIEIGAGFDRTLVVASRPLLIGQMQRVNSGTDVAAARLMLNEAAQSFLATGLTAIALFDKDGREVAHAGFFAQQPALTVPLALPGRAELMWDGSFLLHVVVDMKRDGQVVGKVVAETSLPITTSAFKEANRLGETGELALCAPFDLNMQCFPTTLSARVFTPSQRSSTGALLPMAYALAGETGFISTHDYRNQKVVAAYAPVGDVGLGMVLKMDSAELYASVWDQLRYLIPILFGVLIIALLSLRWLLTPLVRRLIRSEAEAAQRTAELTKEIAEHRQAERSLQEARDKAELATRSKGQFLANMSHEIRTPMNAILGMLTLLEKSTLSAQQDDYVSKTKGAAHSLLGLLNDILDLSKVEAGKMMLDPQPFRLDRMLRDLSVILSAYGGAKPVEVLYDIDPALPDVVRGDAQRLQQVLINLAGNAVKFTAQGEVIVRLQLLQTLADNTRIAFAVQDSGIGIAPENQAHIFSSFSQAEASTTRKFGGTGLGLSISQQLVALMGGRITLTSALGHGSTFAFELELPHISNASDIPAKLVVPSMASAATRNVLVIDDNPVARRLTAKMTQSWHWPTDTAAGCAEALERIREHSSSGGFPYAVVYVDWQMPGMDGWETARQVRQLSTEMGGTRPVIVMMSSHTRESLAERTSEEQALLDGFLVKPVTASMLQEAALGTESATHRLREARRAGGHARRLAGMRILVVEDNLINQQVAEELLMSEGALVSMAANGQLGVDAVAAARPQFDVVLMDIQMPVMDGYTATQTIRSRLGLGALPIVAMTANAMASDREECLAAGMTEHVGKPFDLPKLVQLLLRLTGHTGTNGDSGLPVARDAGGGLQHDRQQAPQPAGEIDVQGAIHRMSGLETLYLRSAKEFVKELASTVEDWLAALPHNPHQAVMQMHTLKGTAALLGAKRLSAEAARLEKLCDEPLTAQACAEQAEPLRRVVRTTQDAMQTVIDEMAARLANSDDARPRVRAAAGAPGVDTPALQEALHALMALLEASNLQALELFAQRRTDFDGVDEAQFSQLEEALQSLELEQALVICRAMALRWAHAHHPGMRANAVG
jgi:signal transduction histidine kinase/CheY-like chemotaxis protein